MTSGDRTATARLRLRVMRRARALGNVSRADPPARCSTGGSIGWSAMSSTASMAVRSPGDILIALVCPGDYADAGQHILQSGRRVRGHYRGRALPFPLSHIDSVLSLA